MEEKEDMNYYRDLVKFTEEWFKRAEAEKHKVMMSEVVGGLEMLKTEFYLSQKWFVQKAAKKALLNEMRDMSNKIVKGIGKGTITISSDGSVMVRKDG